MCPRKRATSSPPPGRRGLPRARIRRIADRLHSASIHVIRRVRAADRESGLTPQRLSALSVVVFAGPVAPGDLAEAEQVSAPVITRLARGLEEQGLIRRFPDPGDGRSTLLEATAAGERVLGEARRRRIRALVERISHLERGDLETLSRAADLMIDAAGGPAGREAARAPLRRRRARPGRRG